jgi:molybdate transport system ATP-binding protein
MAKNPDMLMLDEPFSALDTNLRFSIEAEFLKILKNYNQSVLYVSHSIDEVYTYCDRSAIMFKGEILEIDNTETIFNKPTTLEGAKLTGCRNISEIKKISENLIVALDWGITFKVPSPIDNNIKHIGIRETDISVTCNENGETILNCQ